MSKQNKGFTLIEIISVVIIIGVLLIVVVPSVSRYIEDSRKNTYIRSAEGYIQGVMDMIVSRDLKLKSTDTTYYIPIGCIYVEKEFKSPYGEWVDAYVAVTYNKDKYNYYWTSTDDSNMGVLLTSSNRLDTTRVKPGTDKINLNVGIGERRNITVLREETCTVDGGENYYAIVNIDEDGNLTENVNSDTVATAIEFKSDYYGWSQSKTITILYPRGYTNEYSLDGGLNWNTYTTPIKFTSNGSVTARIIDGSDEKNSKSYVINNIDSTTPTEATFSIAALTSNSIKVAATGTDEESGILYYQFSNDNGRNWTRPQKESEYTFTNLAFGTYEIKVRVINATYDNNGLANSYKESETRSIRTAEVDMPTYTISPSKGYSTSKKVTITYPSGYTNEYSIDGGVYWIAYTEPVTFEKNGTIIARISDGTNYKVSASQTITGVDTTPPTEATINYTYGSSYIEIVAAGTDLESGIGGYQFSIDGGATWTDYQANNTYTYRNLNSGEYLIRARVINKAYTDNPTVNKIDEKTSRNTDIVTVKTKEIDTPGYKVSPIGWATKKTVEIECPTEEEYICEYSIDGGSTWQKYTTPLEFTTAATVTARVTDGTNTKTANSYTITQIDTDKPTTNLVIESTAYDSGVIRIDIKDQGGSSLSGENDYRYYLSTSNTELTGGAWNSYKPNEKFNVSGNSGDYYVWIYPVKDNAGNISGGKTSTTEPYVIGESLTLMLSGFFIGEVRYNTIEEAFLAANSGDKIIGYNSSLLESNGVTSDKTVTVDMNGNSLYGMDKTISGTGTLNMTNNKKIETALKDMTITGYTNYNTSDTDYDKLIFSANNTITITNGNFNNCEFINNQQITINGGTFTLCKFSGNKNVTINGGTFIGGTFEDNDIVNITGGTFTNTTVNDEIIDENYRGQLTKYFVISLSSTTGGTASLSKTKAVKGEAVTVTYTASTGYIFSSITATNATVSGNTVTPNGNGDVVVTVHFTSTRPQYTYTGSSTFIDDGNGNWRIKFLTSGTLTFTNVGNGINGIDVFLVGGGGSGYYRSNNQYSGGGGGGYTKTQKNVSIVNNTSYSIVIGAGGAIPTTEGTGNNGQASSAFGYSASGGYAPNKGVFAYNLITGGNGGSGGGGAANNGGSDGSDGECPDCAGKGQGSTTREFGESTGTLYAGGGGGGGDAYGGWVVTKGGAGGGGGGNVTNTKAGDGVANTGGGGGNAPGLGKCGAGGSGIVVIRNHR